MRQGAAPGHCDQDKLPTWGAGLCLLSATAPAPVPLPPAAAAGVPVMVAAGGYAPTPAGHMPGAELMGRMAGLSMGGPPGQQGGQQQQVCAWAGGRGLGDGGWGMVHQQGRMVLRPPPSSSCKLHGRHCMQPLRPCRPSSTRGFQAGRDPGPGHAHRIALAPATLPSSPSLFSLFIMRPGEAAAQRLARQRPHRAQPPRRRLLRPQRCEPRPALPCPAPPRPL